MRKRVHLYEPFKVGLAVWDSTACGIIYDGNTGRSQRGQALEVVCREPPFNAGHRVTCKRCKARLPTPTRGPDHAE